MHEAVNVIHKIAAMAEAFYVSLAPHNPWSPLSTAISLHLDAVIPNFLIQEIPTAGALAPYATSVAGLRACTAISRPRNRYRNRDDAPRYLTPVHVNWTIPGKC